MIIDVKVLRLLAVLSLLSLCRGQNESTPRVASTTESLDTLVSNSNGHPLMKKGATLWSYWDPTRIRKWGRTLITDGLERFADASADTPWTQRRYGHAGNGKKKLKMELEPDTAHGQSGFLSESGISVGPRPKGAIEKELVTSLFEAMLSTIVETWMVIPQVKVEDPVGELKSPSEVTVTSRRRKSITLKSVPKVFKKTKNELTDIKEVEDPTQRVWWSSPDCKAVICFKNGNIYEGSISMRSMHGEGRFQWADGTVYLGQFKDNEIMGNGLIQWKDDTWYEGEFSRGLRHGRGIYVNSRKQKSYIGQWYCGAKHGKGVMYYSRNFKNSYDGDWDMNVRTGYGSREYCDKSGYKGEWDMYVRHGKGLMIWPNHDFFRGYWNNGLISGSGVYIWDAHHNKSMSLPASIAYHGQLEKGQRHGFGLWNLGQDFGALYKGEFMHNLKHGKGILVTNTGLIINHQQLFVDDNMGPASDSDTNTDEPAINEPLSFKFNDDTVGLFYHVEQAIAKVDKQAEIRANLIAQYIENNRCHTHVTRPSRMKPLKDHMSNLGDVMIFEEISLHKAVSCYINFLKNLYYQYATICNDEEILFQPILIRLYLWQLYYDCSLNEKGLYLKEIDDILFSNPEWLCKSPHDPFEKIYFWQFVHSLISVADRLYAKRKLPGKKPNTILASAFRTLMDNDIIPGAGLRKGHLANGFGRVVPLMSAYGLYRSLGEPHTVRKFLSSVRHPAHAGTAQPELVDAPPETVPFGQNFYMLGQELSFIPNEPFNINSENVNYKDEHLKLFNFGNLSTKSMIKIFSQIFPNITQKGVIMDLDVEMTFFEFFEAFITCAEESIITKDEEIAWREKLLQIGISTCYIATIKKHK